jgi:tetratricopeptide (TPR) repeat protein
MMKSIKRKFLGNELPYFGNNQTGQFSSIFKIFLAGLLSFAPQVHGAPNSLAPKKMNLETQIWTSEDSQLPDLERRVVREIQMNPESAYAHYLLSHISLRFLALDPSDAATMKIATESAQQAVDIDPKSEFGYVALVELLDLTGHSDKGLALINEMKRSGLKSSWRIDLLKARLSVDTALEGDVSALFKTAMDDRDANLDIITPYLISSLHSDDEMTDIAEIERWNSLYPHQNFLQILAVKHSEVGNYQQAHTDYQKIISGDANNKEALINDAILLYKHLNKYKESLAIFDRVAKTGSEQLPEGVQTVYNAHRGSVLLHLNKKKESFQCYISALKSSGNSEAMLNFVGSSFQEINKVKELVELLNLANEENPGSPGMHAYLGELYSEKVKDQKAALESFANAITLDPGQSHYYNLMGLAYYKMDDFDDALKLFSAATKIDPLDATAKYNEACALARTGKQDLALDSLASAIELDPNLRQTAMSDTDFNSLATTRAFIEMLQPEKETHIAH